MCRASFCTFVRSARRVGERKPAGVPGELSDSSWAGHVEFARFEATRRVVGPRSRGGNDADAVEARRAAEAPGFSQQTRTDADMLRRACFRAADGEGRSVYMHLANQRVAA